MRLKVLRRQEHTARTGLRLARFLAWLRTPASVPPVPPVPRTSTRRRITAGQPAAERHQPELNSGSTASMCDLAFLRVSFSSVTADPLEGEAPKRYGVREYEEAVLICRGHWLCSPFCLTAWRTAERQVCLKRSNGRCFWLTSDSSLSHHYILPTILLRP